MADPHVLTTLHAKRENIEAYIADMERRIEEARSDLAHVLATIRTRLFPRNELPRLAREALEAAPDGIDTRAIALHVINAKGADRPGQDDDCGYHNGQGYEQHGG